MGDSQGIKCWCGCGADAFIIVMGQYPLCLECGKMHFRKNRLAIMEVRRLVAKGEAVGA
jgi:hypothetical protein